MAFSVFSLLGFQVWRGKGYLCARKKMWEVEWLSVLIAPFYFSGKVLPSIFPSITYQALMLSAGLEVHSLISCSSTTGRVTEDLFWSVLGLCGGPTRNCHQGYYLHLWCLLKPLGLTLSEETFPSLVSFSSNSFYLCLHYESSPRIKLVRACTATFTLRSQIPRGSGAQKQNTKFWLRERKERWHSCFCAFCISENNMPINMQ